MPPLSSEHPEHGNLIAPLTYGKGNRVKDKEYAHKKGDQTEGEKIEPVGINHLLNSSQTFLGRLYSDISRQEFLQLRHNRFGVSLPFQEQINTIQSTDAIKSILGNGDVYQGHIAFKRTSRAFEFQ